MFTVIEGNLLIGDRDAGGAFVSAEATRTRLMGVIGLHIHRKRDDENFHQFFYLDTEEYGLDDYQSMINPSKEEVSQKKAELFGAFGGEWIKITEKEALLLVRHYSRINRTRHMPLPDGIEEYAPILETDFSFSAEEANALWKKICIETRNDYELINYYLMRMTAGDNELLAYLTELDGHNIKPFEVKQPGTLLKNDISKGDDFDPYLSMRTYTCVSLVDIDKVYSLIESEITIIGKKVVGFQAKKPMPISSWEASLIVNKAEYIIHGRVDLDGEQFKEIMLSIFGAATESSYDFGSLYMVFRKNNDHVKRKEYRLDQDTIGIVCHFNNGEIVFAGNETVEIEMVESSIVAALAAKGIGIEITGSYKFPEPILVRFIDSELDSFQEFLDYLETFKNE